MGRFGSESGRFIASTDANSRLFGDTYGIVIEGNAGVVRQLLFTVTFDSDGGSAVAQQIVPDGDTATLPAAPTRAWELTAGLWRDASFQNVTESSGCLT